MDMSQYLEIFIEESKEHLQGLNEALLRLEENPGEKNEVNEIFRAAHTLKGMSATMGFTKMSTLTHDMEDVLHAVRSDEIELTPGIIDTLFQCLDALENYVESVIETSSEGDNEYKGIINALKAALTGEAPTPAPEAKEESKENEEVLSEHPTRDFLLNEYDENIVRKAKETDMNVYKLTVVLNKSCVLKSARSFIIFQTLEKHSDIIKSEPKVEDIEDERFDQEFTVVIVSEKDKEVFTKEIMSIAEVEEVIITDVEVGTSQKKEDKEDKKTKGDTEKTPVEDQPVSKAPAKSGKKPRTGKTVRVDIDRLDILLNLVSELIIQKTRLEGIDIGDRTQNYTETLEYLERITTNLHDAVMKVRMVPVDTVFNRFPRMLRDIAKGLGKKVNLEMSGEETELDRTVIDEIGDPLIHLLRNSADHGVEPIEKRREAGKPDTGNIHLKAYQDGNNVVIEVGDDGQGINVEKVRKSIIKKGLLTADVAEKLPPKDVIDYLFKPSFSTADQITDLSGRGVGLDVVKTKIESLGGIVEVETEIGQGSRFYIRLPLTLAIVQALLVSIGMETYAIQLSSISQILTISPDEIQMVQEQEVFMLRNMVIPVVRLNKILQVVEKEEVDEKRKNRITVVIVKKGEKLSGFVVDSIIGQQEIVQKSMGKYFAGLKLITSATILGDGNVALILDVNSLAK